MAVSTSGSMAVSVSLERERAVVRVAGAVDEDGRALFRRRLEEAIGLPVDQIDVDLQDVDLLSAAGISELVRAEVCAADRGKRMTIVAVSPRAQRVLDLTDVVSLPDVITLPADERRVLPGSGRALPGY